MQTYIHTYKQTDIHYILAYIHIHIHIYIYTHIITKNRCELNEKVGVGDFIVLNLETLTPASIKSQTPRYFQVDDF